MNWVVIFSRDYWQLFNLETHKSEGKYMSREIAKHKLLRMQEQEDANEQI